jgi:hypothetical protein
MAEIVHIYRCLVDHFEMQVTVCTTYKCPACGRIMTYITSRRRA